MTGTNLQRKRSDYGAALLLTVSIIGLAFVVTLAAFLIGASVAQDTERVASAKVDIANREDVLMRLILQQTATGILPGTDGINGAPQNWTTIMTNAVNQLRATTYVDPAEMAALTGLSGLIPDNMADTGGSTLGIFQGYSSANPEIPFGGTSGLANVVPSYNATVQPPLMSWSGNATLSSSNALTVPQEFFLGSQYTGVSSVVTKLSSVNRWGKITYPNIRFGYKGAGDPFIARRIWWRIPVLYQTAQQTVEDQSGVYRYPKAAINNVPSINYILSVYEIPSQLPISGNANLQIGQNADGTAWGSWVQIAGSIYGDQIQLYGGTYNGVSGVSRGGISSRQQVNVLKQATVAGETYSDNTYDNLKVRETRDLTRSISTTGVGQIGAAPVSVAGNDGKVLMMPVMPGANFYMAAAGTPTHWDLYARPYYRCRIRVIISNTNSKLIYSPTANPQLSTDPTAGAITVKVIALPDTSSQPDQILGIPDSGGTTYPQTSYASGGLPAYMTYTSTGTGTSADRNILVINIGAMVTALGNPAQLYSIYIGSNPTTEPASAATASDPAIAITGTTDLSSFTNGLSIVANQPLYLLDNFNQVKIASLSLFPPTSIYSPDIRYGVSGVNPTLNLVGQVLVDPTPTLSPTPSASPSPAHPLNFVDGAGGAVSASSANNTFNLTEIIDPTPTGTSNSNMQNMPPITRLTLLFTIEKERPTN
ncbi:MAG: hypothetical protein WB696_26870 [Chthoniobacterales bacterium]